MRLIVQSLAFAAALLVLAGCGGGSGGPDGAQPDALRDGPAGPRGPNPSVRVERSASALPSGADADRNTNLPFGFPDDVFVSSAWSIQAISPAPGSGYAVQSMTRRTADEVFALVREEMTELGWTESAEQNTTDLTPRIGFEKDKRTTAITVTPVGRINAVELVTTIRP